MMDRDSPMGRGWMMGMMGGCPMMGADGQASTFIEGRIAFLKAELAITDAQKGAWDAYADATKRNLESMQGMWQTMKSVFEAKTPMERLDAHLAAMESRTKVLKDVKPELGLGIGVIDIKDNEVETAEEVARRIDHAAGVLGVERICYLHPDCGFWMLPRSVADAKMRALVAGRNLFTGKS